LFSFVEDLPVLIKTLDMMHAGKNIQVSVDIQENIVSPLDREDILKLFGNLLDNAYKWARHEIRVHVHVDDAPGADPEKINALSRRGVRLDETVEGHGFGLANAADMVADYQGLLQFKRSADLGGFMAEISVPSHPVS